MKALVFHGPGVKAWEDVFFGVVAKCPAEVTPGGVPAPASDGTRPT
jgi:hypothetical protein